MTPSPLTPPRRTLRALPAAATALCVAATLLGACTPLPTTPRNAPLLIADQPGNGATPPQPLPQRGIQFDQNDYSVKDKYALDQRRDTNSRTTPDRPAGDYATK
jgi:hypothetical protein